MILVGGEALIDLFVCPDDPSGCSLVAGAGGSPWNVALGISRLGTAAAFLGGISTDHFGALLMRTARAEGVNTDLVRRTHRPTPLVAVTPDALGHPNYAFYAHETAEQALTKAELRSPLSADIQALALGSYTLSVGPVGDALLSLAKREACRRVISIDPNLRLAMVGALGAWRSRIDEFAQCAAIMKVSEEDIATGWGEQESGDHLAATWLSSGVNLVVMTRGASGATAWWPGGTVCVPGRTVAVVDTVGAGDSFHAALLARMAQRRLLDRAALAGLDRPAIEDALRYAIAAASITCSRRGADVPRRGEVDAVFDAT